MSEVNYGSRPDEIVTYGSHISLKHYETGRYLTSFGGMNYSSGSEQQMVFGGECEPNDDANWIVIPGLESDAERGNDVNFGETIRLKHIPTRCNLHSHPDIESPVTGQQEVTCFGDDSTSDENDEWVVEKWTIEEEYSDDYDFEDDTWYVGRACYLRHKKTGRTLHTHEVALNDDATEVTCFDGPDINDKWRVTF